MTPAEHDVVIAEILDKLSIVVERQTVYGGTATTDSVRITVTLKYESRVVSSDWTTIQEPA